MTVLSNIITPSNVLTTTNTATVTNKTLTAPTVTGMVVSDGTANGVTYLNGSKVLTSGSALVFDGTNLGLGVTPSATFSGYTALNFSASSIYNYSAASNRQTHIYNNGFINSSGNAAYLNSDPASRIYMTNGTISFGVAASGTAGNAISFTQAMTLGSDGNLAIGTTSTSGARLKVDGGATSGTIGQFGNAQGGVILGAASSVAYVDTTSSTPLAFNINGTERARIDGSGNFLIGGSTQIWDEKALVRNSTNTVILGVYGTNASYTSSAIRCQVETAAGTGWYFFEGRSGGGTFQYGIRGNGTVATSDERRKKNIEPARSYLEDICKIPVIKYNWKSDADGAQKELGWIAQDVQKVFPSMVVTHHDGPNDDQEVLLLKKEVFLPMLMKCIQEQQAIIESLKARLDAANL